MTSLTETSNSLGEEVAEAGRVEDAGHAADLLDRQARELAQRPDHRVERVGDADDEGVRRVLGDALADRLHHLEVDAEQVVAAHARLARHAGGDDADVGAGDRPRRSWRPRARRRSRRSGADSAMSSALPCGVPSAMSKSTTSPSSFSAARWASVPPICPAPISAIFGLAMSPFPPLRCENRLVASPSRSLSQVRNHVPEGRPPRDPRLRLLRRGHPGGPDLGGLEGGLRRRRGLRLGAAPRARLAAGAGGRAAAAAAHADGPGLAAPLLAQVGLARTRCC